MPSSVKLAIGGGVKAIQLRGKNITAKELLKIGERHIFFNLFNICNKIQTEIHTIQSYPQADYSQKHRVFWVSCLPNTPIFRHQLPFSWHTPSLSDPLHMLLLYSSGLHHNQAPLQSLHLRLYQLRHLQ